MLVERRTKRLREDHMIDRSVWKDSTSLSGAAGVTTSGVCPHASVNHMVFFLYHGFIIFMYINKILMKTIYFYIMCELL